MPLGAGLVVVVDVVDVDADVFEVVVGECPDCASSGRQFHPIKEAITADWGGPWGHDEVAGHLPVAVSTEVNDSPFPIEPELGPDEVLARPDGRDR